MDNAYIPVWKACFALCFGIRLEQFDVARWYSAHASQGNEVTLEFGSPCSPRSNCLLMTRSVMINNASPRSFTKCFVSNVERFAFMSRTCLRTVWHIFCVCFNNGLPRSILCQFNVETLPVVRWTCVFYSFPQRVSPIYPKKQLHLREENLHRSPENGTFSSILHGSRVSSNNGSPRSLTTWIWNWLVQLETST